jgi:hypothetical protein
VESTVILHFNYEEIRAIKAGARSLLEGDPEASSPVLAPHESRARLEALLPRLDGDLSLSSLSELRGVGLAVAAVVEFLRAGLESAVLATHAADELAVEAYFDFAHALTVSRRLAEMASEMEALIELMTGETPDSETARSFRFPD